MIFAVGFLYILALIFLTYRQNIKRQTIDLIPSWGWAVFMLGPFVIWHKTLAAEYLLPQAVGVFSVGATLLLADVWSPFSKREGSKFFKVHFSLGYVLFFLILALQITHLAKMPQIPLWEKYFGNPTGLDLVNMRENSSKLLNARTWFIYLCQSTITVLSPLLLSIFLYGRRFAAAFILFISTAVYAKATLAKGPVFVFILLVLGILYLVNPNKWAIRIVIGIAVSYFFLLTFHPLGIRAIGSAKNPVVQENYLNHVGVEKQHSHSVSDQYRDLALSSHYSQNTSESFRILHHLFYRAILAPVDVSHRWYSFFPSVEGRFLGFYGLTKSSRQSKDFIHPGTAVGRWAYVSRYPDSFISSLVAYASADADGWARWGYAGIFFVVILIFGIRMLMKLLRTSDYVGSCIYLSMLLLLSISLPAGSVQAMMVAQGFVIYLLVQAVYALKESRLDIFAKLTYFFGLRT